MNNPILLSGKSDKSLMVFNNTDFGSIRTVELNGKIYFCGKDVAGALGYKETAKAIREHCKGVSKIDIPTKGGIQETSFIPEGDVYRLITSSKLPTAEKFESWVFDEVLPSIRKNGGYIENQENLTDEQLMAKALLVAQNVIAKKDAAIEEMKPKADVYDQLVDRSKCINFRDFASKIGFTQNEFMTILKSKYIYKNSIGEYRAYSEYQKYFCLRTFSKGVDKTGEQLMLNMDGITYFTEKYKPGAVAESFIEKGEKEYQKIMNETAGKYLNANAEDCSYKAE